MEPLITKYRPQILEEVAGHEVAVKSLRDALDSPSRPHSFLFSGPPGLGKTTMARIVASMVGASVTEIDIASHAGVEDARELVDMSNFTPVIAEQSRMYILDECHVFSKTAWQALLKLLEEPPPFLYIALCTTDPSKVPESIKTRCFHTVLKPLSANTMSEFIDVVCELEGWQVVPDVLTGIIQASTGQPRKALSILQAGHGVQSREELAQIIASVEVESSPVIDLCKYLMQGGKDWKRIADLLNGIEDEEEAFAHASRYITSVMLKSDEGSAKRGWAILDALTYPRTCWDKKVHLAVAVGGILWS